jgi:hypothetical protein
MHDRRPGDPIRRPPAPAIAPRARLLAGELRPAVADVAESPAAEAPSAEPSVDDASAVEGVGEEGAMAAAWAGVLREAARGVAVGPRPSGAVRPPGPYDDGLAASRAPSPGGEAHLDRLG